MKLICPVIAASIVAFRERQRLVCTYVHHTRYFFLKDTTRLCETDVFVLSFVAAACERYRHVRTELHTIPSSFVFGTQTVFTISKQAVLKNMGTILKQFTFQTKETKAVHACMSRAVPHRALQQRAVISSRAAGRHTVTVALRNIRYCSCPQSKAQRLPSYPDAEKTKHACSIQQQPIEYQ